VAEGSRNLEFHLRRKPGAAAAMLSRTLKSGMPPLAKRPNLVDVHLGAVRKDPDLFSSNSETGWGGRIRTYVWRIQSPLPYHLATPQWVRVDPSIGSL
jgi:hypothetical protein